MGKENDVVIEYLSQPEVFADLFNGYVFKGKQVICVENLEEAEREIRSFWANEKVKTSFETMKKQRDIVRNPKILAKLPPIVRYEAEEPVREEITSKQEFKIHIEDGIYVVEAPWLMHALGYVDLDDYESLQYFQRVLRLSGIIDKLEEMGINEGDTVSILDIEFDYMR